MKLGFFAVARANEHYKKNTKVHILDKNSNPICGYKHRLTSDYICYTLKSRQCKDDEFLAHVDCKECIKKYGEQKV